jgi:signal transduction histidine kinase
VSSAEGAPPGVTTALPCYLAVTAARHDQSVTTGRTPGPSVLRLPRPTVRWRLTLLYGVLFLICGAGLLAITYTLFASFADSPPKPRLGPGGGAPSPTALRVASAMYIQRSIGLHRLLVYSGVALAIMGLVSGVLGWVVAGRVLAPLRTIIATADQISDANLHQRLAMGGAQDELSLLADMIDRLLARLEAAFEAQRRFVANASHELRTPLAMMRTTLDVAIAKPGQIPARTRALDAELRLDLDHADRLLESFLTLASAQNGQLGEPSQVGLDALIRVALSDRAYRISEKALTISTDLEPVEVVGSSTLLARMIDNVVENAVRHTEPDGLIDIALTAPDRGQARIVVATSGPVLDPGAVAQLAQPFRRLSQDRTGPQDGHGLGLSIVAAVAAAHAGSLELQAPTEGGLQVNITLSAASLPQLARASG